MDANKRYPHFTSGEKVEWNQIGFHKPQGGALFLMSYFIKWYKTGKRPTTTKDILVYSYRTHKKKAVASNDPLGPVTRFIGKVKDNIYITTILTAPAVLIVSSGNTVTRRDVAAGMQHSQIPFHIGPQRFSLMRNGKEILTTKAEDIISNPKYYNFFHTTGVVVGHRLDPLDDINRW